MPSISLLDFGIFNEPHAPCMSIISHLIKNIPNYENMGYKRFWLTEHYGDTSAWTSPEILISLLSQKSRKIRIGAAGILLKYNNPFRVAQSFSLMNSIFDGRIDLGLAQGNVVGSYIHALNKTFEAPDQKYFFDQTEELFHFLNQTYQQDHLYGKIKINPTHKDRLNTWFLGSSEQSTSMAIKYQSNFCLSLFHSQLSYKKTLHIPELFRDLFYKEYGYIPECAIALKCYSSENKKNIEKFRYIIDNSPWFNKSHAMIGSINEISDKILDLCYLYKVDDIVIVNEFIDLEEKIETAEAYSLSLLKR